MEFLAKFLHYYALINLNRLNNMTGQHTCSSSVTQMRPHFVLSLVPTWLIMPHAGQRHSTRNHESAQLHSTALPSHPLSWESACVSFQEGVPEGLFCAHPNALQNISLLMKSGRAFVNLPPSLIYFLTYFKPKKKMSCLSCLSFLMSLCNRIT